MAKCAVGIGYKTFVLDAEQGVQLMELLSNAEIYEEKYNGSGKPTTYHVYPNEGHASSDGVAMSMKVLSDKFYQMAKLAGKPSKES